MAPPALPSGRIGRDVLALLLDAPGQELHTREIARRVKADAHPVQRALERMLAAGLVQSRRLGNLRLWSARDSELAGPTREILRRTTGLAAALRTALASMRGVQLAFLFGSYASGTDRFGSDVDLFVVGSPEWSALSREIAEQETSVGREINPVVWTVDDLERPTPTQWRFLDGVMRKPIIWLVGGDDELERLRPTVGRKLVPKPSRSSGPRRSRRGATAPRAR